MARSSTILPAAGYAAQEPRVTPQKSRGFSCTGESASLCVLAHGIQGGMRITLAAKSNPGMDVTMYREHGKLIDHGPAIECLAQESQVSVDDVARLYANELAKLEVGARIRSFLPIFAIKKVREVLRLRSAEKRPIAQARGGWNGWIGRAPGSSRRTRLGARLRTHRALPASARQMNSAGGAFLW